MKINTEKQEKYKDYILSNYTCDITTGTIFNKKRLQVGASHDSGYIVLHVKRKHFRAHRIVWLFAHGSFPDATLDHIDNDRHNNAISNLRLADYSKNAANKLKTKKRKTTSTYKGVHYRKDNKKWRYVANKIRKDLNEHKCFNNDVRGDITQLLCQERVEEALIKYNCSIMCLLYGALVIQEIEV
jgi:hypothetical protein